MKNKISNRKAHYEYNIIKEYVAGIELLGSEVKSLRCNNANINDSYVYITSKEIFVVNSFIAKYNQSSYLNHEEKRQRKLLLKRKEINELTKRVKDIGITIIPLEIFVHNGRFKMKIAICKGKKLWDKRQNIKERDIQRDIKNIKFDR